MTTTAHTRPATRPSPRLHTIGAVCRRLKEEFPDVSISKIRYLEDQGLLSLRRTPGGYRLFGEEDIQRLQTILRLQRDEFLPLRVIRQELSSPVPKGRRRARKSLTAAEETVTLEELCERAGVTAQFARELDEFGLIEPADGSTERRYRESDVQVAAVCSRIARYGVAARHLRAFRTAADREAALLQQLAAPALRSRNPDRRRDGLRDLQALGELSQELSQLLLWRELRRVAAT